MSLPPLVKSDNPVGCKYLLTIESSSMMEKLLQTRMFYHSIIKSPILLIITRSFKKFIRSSHMKYVLSIECFLLIDDFVTLR